MKTMTTLSGTLNKDKVFSPHFILLLAFAGVYVLWGSTYLAISILIKTVPMFLMAGFRFLLASSFMFLWAFLAKHPLPSKKEAQKSCINGFLLLVLGNGGILIANRYIASSGVIAILVAITPLIMAFLEWCTGKAEKPSFSVWLGMLIGIAGILVLSGPENLKSLGHDSKIGIFIILFSCFSWAMGTLYSRTGSTPSSPIFNSAIQMVFSSACMFLIGTMEGEWQFVEWSNYGLKEAVSFLYLVVGGSVLGFTAYTYITKNASPSSVSTYAYVNPVIALLLGWQIGKETISPQTILASMLLVGGVVLIVLKPTWKRPISK